MKNPITFNPKKELILPEYGRNIQNLVEYAVNIKDKEERTKCANTIIRIMGTMFPYLRDREDFKHKLWDHLAIISDFKLDIDYPFEIVKKENINPKPVPLSYSTRKARYMHYGKNIEHLIEAATKIEEPNKRSRLTELICYYMKKSLIERNKESATDKKVVDDLRILSGYQLEVQEDASFLSVEEFKRAKLQRGEMFTKKNKKNKKNNKKNKSQNNR